MYSAAPQQCAAPSFEKVCRLGAAPAPRKVARSWAALAVRQLPQMLLKLDHTLPTVCRYARPARVCLVTKAMSSSGSGASAARMRSETLPPAQYSMAIHNASGAFQLPCRELDMSPEQTEALRSTAHPVCVEASRKILAQHVRHAGARWDTRQERSTAAAASSRCHGEDLLPACDV